MERLKVQISVGKKVDRVQIVPLGDLHYGHPNCRLDLFKKSIDYIIGREQCYAILMGDLWDSIILDDPRATPTTPTAIGYQPVSKQDKEQERFASVLACYRELKKVLMPLVENKRLLCCITGNHELKLWKKGFGDLTLHFCSEEKVPYGGISCFLQVQFAPKLHKEDLIIWMHHGWQSSRKPGAAINLLEDLPSRFVGADIYLLAHNHRLLSTKEDVITIRGDRTILMAYTGGFLEGYSWKKMPSYIEEKGYPPIRLGHQKIDYYPYRKERFFISS